MNLFLLAILFSSCVILLRRDRIEISKKKNMEKQTETEDGMKHN